MSQADLTQTDYAQLVGVERDRMKPVRIWLYVIAAMVLAMVMIGGITRLTDSGLSITSWKPISGIIPPLSAADWQAEFQGYQQIPQFQIQNQGMTVEQFKSIFWWEWIHRFLGRIIGFVFFVPFLVFLAQKRLSWELAPKLLLIFALGALQGFIGWWMVSSGLTLRTEVSQYRLATHLATAGLLYAALIWVARSLVERSRAKAPAGWFAIIAGLTVVIYIQIIAGAFVAGLDAGFSYNTWPLMDGAIVPQGLDAMQPWWRNWFENALAVQFHHRMLAYFIAVLAGLIVWYGWKKTALAGVHKWLGWIGGLIAFQIVLGITTLVLVVPVSLAVAHQVTAFVIFGAAIAYLSDQREHRAVS